MSEGAGVRQDTIPKELNNFARGILSFTILKLKGNLQPSPEHFVGIEARYPLTNLGSNSKPASEGGAVGLIANLPYTITITIIMDPLSVELKS